MRSKIGTDIFIYGFNAVDKWQENILFELIENFLVTIYSGKLVVNVQGKTLNKNSLQKIMQNNDEYLKSHKSQSRSYYKILTATDSDLKIFEETFHNLGKLKLKVLVDNQADLNRKILVIRQMGMKIFDFDRISRQLSFTGIVELEGEELNNFFRQMENPEHNNWEPERHPNSALAKKYFDDFKKWVRAKVQSLSENFTSDEKNVEGLSENLQVKKNLVEIKTSERKFENLNSVASSKILIVQSIDSQKNKNLAEKGGSENSSFKRTRGTVTDAKGGTPAIRTLKGNRPRKNKKSHTGIEDTDGEDIILTPDGNFLECKSRVIKIGKNSYRLIFTLSKEIFNGVIRIFAVGENDEQEQLKVASVKANSNVQLSNQAIKLLYIPANRNFKIDFSLTDDNDYSIKAYIYENRQPNF